MLKLQLISRGQILHRLTTAHPELPLFGEKRKKKGEKRKRASALIGLWIPRCSRFALVSCLEQGHLCTAIIQSLDHVSGKALQIHGTEDFAEKEPHDASCQKHTFELPVSSSASDTVSATHRHSTSLGLFHQTNAWPHPHAARLPTLPDSSCRRDGFSKLPGCCCCCLVKTQSCRWSSP